MFILENDKSYCNTDTSTTLEECLVESILTMQEFGVYLCEGMRMEASNTLMLSEEEGKPNVFVKMWNRAKGFFMRILDGFSKVFKFIKIKLVVNKYKYCEIPGGIDGLKRAAKLVATIKELFTNASIIDLTFCYKKDNPNSAEWNAKIDGLSKRLKGVSTDCDSQFDEWRKVIKTYDKAHVGEVHEYVGRLEDHCNSLKEKVAKFEPAPMLQSYQFEKRLDQLKMESHSAIMMVIPRYLNLILREVSKSASIMASNLKKVSDEAEKINRG